MEERAVSEEENKVIVVVVVLPAKCRQDTAAAN